MLLCCLRRNVEASCHNLRRRLPPSTNSATYQRLVSSTRHGPSQPSILHLALEPFTARSGARYWIRIVILGCLYQTCIRCHRYTGFPSEYCRDLWCGKTRMLWLSDGKQEVKVIWQKAPHGGLNPRLGVTPGGRKLYHWIPGGRVSC